MKSPILLALWLVSIFSARAVLSVNSVHKYCVIGAGPGGLQIGYFLERAGRDYVIFEKNTAAGSFFTHYPRHRTLISINKRHTGSKNREFSFRHDWNSLISDDPTLLLKHYTEEYFPQADVYVRYLQDYAEKFQLRIQYGTEIKEVDRQSEVERQSEREEDRTHFSLRDQNGTIYRCSVVIVSTGVWVPHIPEMSGIHHAEGYESMSIDRKDYEGKRVLIIGRARALAHHLEWKYEGVLWPSVSMPSTDLPNYMLKRINEASGPYQMFGILADVALLRANGTVVYLEEVPIQSLPIIEEMTGHEAGPIVIWNFEYGPDYSGPGKDVLREDRAIGDPFQGDQSNFLHPVLYYYKNFPSSFKGLSKGKLPPPDLYHHIVENFLTEWTQRKDHVIPVRRFFEAVFDADMRSFFAQTCFQLILTHGDNIPLFCQQHYLRGHSVSTGDETMTFGPPELFLDTLLSH